MFDYIRAETPNLASNLVEVRKIVDRFGVGTIVDKINPLKIDEG